MEKIEPTPSGWLERPSSARIDRAIRQDGFHESWLLQIVDSQQGFHAWLRFGFLASRNGFRKHASVSLVHFRNDGQNLRIRNGFGLRESFVEEQPSALRVRIGSNELSESVSMGSVEQKNHRASWALEWTAKDQGVSLTPSLFTLPGLSQTRFSVPFHSLRISGRIEIDGQEFVLNEAQGTILHTEGSRQAKQWWWAKAQTFEDQAGTRLPLEFVGVTGLSSLPLPRQSAFWILWKDQTFLLNSITRNWLTRSKASDYRWEFSYRQGEYDFHGQLEVPPNSVLRDEFEDTDGTPLLSLKSGRARLALQIYRDGQLEASGTCRELVSWEHVTRR